MSLSKVTSAPPRSVCALVLVVALLLTLPGTAQAHGKLKATSPAAGAHLGTVPGELRLDFSEVPELAFSRVRLIGPTGLAVALGPLGYAADSRRAVVTAIREVLSAGEYRVEWQLAGDDGHPVRGDYRFTIAPGAMASHAPSAVTPSIVGGAGDAPMIMHHDPASMPQGAGFGAESPAYVALRWVQFVALLLVIGTVTFRQFVLGSMRGGTDAPLELIHSAGLRATRVGLAATGVLAATLLGRLAAQSYAMHGAEGVWDAGASMDMIRNTTWGRGWLVQTIGVMLAATGLVLARRSALHRALRGQKGGHAGSPHLGWSLATLGVLFLALSAALSGHAAAVPRWRGGAILADTLHIIGASSWLGSLTLLLLAGIPAALAIGAEARGEGVTRLVTAFSPVALGGAGVAVVTGAIAAWLHLGRIPALWGSRYGVTLMIKLAVLSVVALTGFYNWRFVQPRLGTDDATARLRRSAAVEVGVAVLVLLVTAVLVATPTALDMDM